MWAPVPDVTVHTAVSWPHSSSSAVPFTTESHVFMVLPKTHTFQELCQSTPISFVLEEVAKQGPFLSLCLSNGIKCIWAEDNFWAKISRACNNLSLSIYAMQIKISLERESGLLFILFPFVCLYLSLKLKMYFSHLSNPDYCSTTCDSCNHCLTTR